MIHMGFLAWTFKSIAACFLLKTCLELLSLRNDKFYSFEETITGDYGNQTEIHIHWTEIHINHKKQLGSPQINVLERIMLVELSSNIVKLFFLSDLQSIVRKIFIPVPNLYLYFLFLKLPEQTNLLPLRIFVNRCYQPFKVSLHQHLTLWYPAF